MPSDITVAADEGKCNATVSYTEPTATVGCGKAEIRLASGQASGSAFGIGCQVADLYVNVKIGSLTTTTNCLA